MSNYLCILVNIRGVPLQGELFSRINLLYFTYDLLIQKLLASSYLQSFL